MSDNDQYFDENGLIDIDSLPVFDFPHGLSYDQIEPLVSDMSKYLSFQREFGCPKSVLYPSCDVDVTPVKAFPNSSVTLLDINPEAVEALKRHGYNALCMNIDDYSPSNKHNLVILLNPQIRSESALKNLANGGFVLANNYHANAREILEMRDSYDFLGVYDSKNGESVRVPSSSGLVSRIQEGIDGFYLFKKKQ